MPDTSLLPIAEMEAIKMSLDFCRGCEGHAILPDGNEFYFCDRLGVVARKIAGSWIIFTNINEPRLRRLCAMGLRGMMDELFMKSEGRA
jgi:hypothetical protein